jgi:hypothetical protein
MRPHGATRSFRVLVVSKRFHRRRIAAFHSPKPITSPARADWLIGAGMKLPLSLKQGASVSQA